MDVKKFAIVWFLIFLFGVWKGGSIISVAVVSIGITFFFLLIFAAVFETLLEPFYKWLGKK